MSWIKVHRFSLPLVTSKIVPISNENSSSSCKEKSSHRWKGENSRQRNTEHTNVEMIQLSECLAPSRPDLIFTTAKPSPKYFYITAAQKIWEGNIWDDNIDANNKFALAKVYDATIKNVSNCIYLSCWIFLIEFFPSLFFISF